jgi:NAD(P)-dependent dehydrogenase (short-subunit alcohol dehydrogenase family)
MDLGLAGKVVCVTGGSSGIGRATAARLLAEGARVAICARNADRLETSAAELRAAHGEALLAVPADVSTAAGVQQFVQAALERFGILHGLVNNAGSSGARAFLDVTDADWQADIDIKLMAAIRMTRLCLPPLRETHGAIVNVVAIGGKAPGPRSVPSTVTRAAGLALTKALSKEFAPDGVRVNAICIGTVRSGQHDPEWEHEFAHLTRDQFYADVARKRAIPLGRVGEAEEAGDLIAYLLSERAAFISGTAVNLDGAASPAW